MKRILIGTILAALTLATAKTMAADKKSETPLKPKDPTLTLAIHCDQTELKWGDEIPIVFVIKNEGDEPYQYYERGSLARRPEYKLSAIAQDGTPIPDPLANSRGDPEEGPARLDTLPPGNSLTRTAILNRWALLTNAGTYRVTGTYYAKDKEIVSAPIEIVIQPRSDQEMGVYINELTARLKACQKARQKPDSGQEQDGLIRKLVFTRDNRIMPALIDALYEDSQGDTPGQMAYWDIEYWTDEALSYYLPRDERNTAALVKAATERGMTGGMCVMLQRLGCSREQIKKLIPISLSPDHPNAWPEGALAAQQFCDDSFMPRLIAIAMDKDGNGKDQAIFALAMNRTDESVAALKQLLNYKEPRPFGRESIAQETAQAIRSAYLSRGNSDGRKLRPDDFGPEYQRSQ